MYKGIPKGLLSRMAPKMEIKQAEEPQMFEGTNQLSNTARPSKNNQSVQQCYCCWGWGHMAKECATPLNYLKGKVSTSLPPKMKEIKGNRKPTDPTQTDPITLKTIRKHYHNPDPIAHLVGKVNEAHILIDDVECLALIDLGAQISTITVEFVTQLGLKIYQLDGIQVGPT